MKSKNKRTRNSSITERMVILSPNEFKKLKRKKNIAVFISIISVGIAGLSFYIYNTNAKRLIDVCSKYEKLSDEYSTLYEEYTTLYDQTAKGQDYIDDCEFQIEELCKVNEELDKQNKSLVASNEDYYNNLQQLEARKELFDKYEYAITRSDGTRTDITYDQLKTVEDLCKEKKVDTDLVLAICMVESSGTENAKNKSSTASGYGQMLSGTGEFVYEKLMKEGNYDHSLALDGDTNLKMVVEYIAYLDERNNSLYKVIENYRGDPSDLNNYVAKLDRYLSKKGKSVELLNRQ